MFGYTTIDFNWFEALCCIWLFGIGLKYISNRNCYKLIQSLTW